MIYGNYNIKRTKSKQVFFLPHSNTAAAKEVKKLLKFLDMNMHLIV